MSRKFRNDQQIRRRPRRQAPPRRAARLASFLVREAGSVVAKIITFTALAALFLLLVLDGTTIVMDRLDPRVERWVSKRLAGPEVDIGSVSFSLGAGDQPAGLTLNDVTVAETETSPQVTVPSVETGFAVIDTMRDGLRPRTVSITGATLSLIRQRDGAIRLFGSDAPDDPGMVVGNDAGPVEVPQLSTLLDDLLRFQAPQILGQLQEVELTGTRVAFFDRKQGVSWTTRDARIGVTRDEDGLSATLRASFLPGGGVPASVSLQVDQAAGSGDTRVELTVADARPADLASLLPQLDWLRVIDAPVAGSLAATVDGDGTLSTLSGTLKLGSGALHPPDTVPVAFDLAQIYFGFDPATQVFRIDSLDITGESGAVGASGRIEMQRGDDGALSALVGELALRDVHIHAPKYLSRDLAMDSGDMVARVGFDPFRVEVASATLSADAAHVMVSGEVAALSDRWRVALDARTSALDYQDGIALWPDELRPQLRAWIGKHVTDGRIDHAQAFLRLDGDEPQFGVEFDFSGARFRPIDTMPAVVAAHGTGQLIGHRFDLVLDRGVTGAGAGAGLDLSGSRMVVEDVRIDPQVAEFHLDGQGPAGSVLALIDNEPLEFLTKAGRSADLADGMVTAQAYLKLPLVKRLRMADVTARVGATIAGARSDRAVPGHLLTADELVVTASNDHLQIAGGVALDGVPMRVTFDRALGPDAPDTARVEGSFTATPDALAALRLPIPAEAFQGTAAVRFALDLPESAAPRYTLRAGLSDTALSIPPLGWTKPRGQAGQLEARGRLGEPPTLDGFSLSGPGLSAEGRLAMSGSRLTSADFSRLRLGRWLDAPVRWRSGAGSDTVTIAGGTIDLRSGFNLRAGGGTPMIVDLSPDRIIVSDNIYLRGVEGRIETAKGPRGRFRGTVNGQADVTGVLQPGPEIFIESSSGGEALAAARIFDNAKGGTLRARIAPDADGLRGAFSLKNTRVQNAPVLAEILNLASVIGIPDRLAGPGIGFDDVQGRFRITPGRIRLTKARAIGPSLGVTLEGVYDLARDQLAMEGVVSPFYAVNGLAERVPVLGRLLGGKPGQGVLGANFRVTGSAEQPQVAVNPLSVLTPGAVREIFQTRSASNP